MPAPGGEGSGVCTLRTMTAARAGVDGSPALIRAARGGRGGFAAGALLETRPPSGEVTFIE
jgi:hypothetical protein